MPPKAKPKLRDDVNETAYRVMREAIGEPLTPDPGKSEEAAKRGSKGGKKGGRARAESLSAPKRSKIAKQAARTRWRRTED